MSFLLSLWARARTWIVAIAAAVFAIASAWLFGRHQGADRQRASDEKEQAETNLQAAQQAAAAQENRNDVEAKVSELPSAPPQPVAQADPATAAGKLRDDGWVRD